MSTSNLKALKAVQQVPIDFVAFSGGGAKGAVYSGVYEALKLADTMEEVKFVTGASAGAITAALVATGIKPENFEKISKKTNLRGLLGEKGFVLVNKDGTPLYELLQDTIRDNIAESLPQSSVEEVAKARFGEILKEQIAIQNKQKDLDKKVEILEGDINELKRQTHLMDAPSAVRVLEQKLQLLELERRRLDESVKTLQYDEAQSQNQAKIMEAIATGKSSEFEDLKKRCFEKGGKIYFKDLDILRAFDPKRFKDLAVTAVRKDNGELFTFSSSNTPNVEIALACRASASIPGVFASVEIAIPEVVKDSHGLYQTVEKKYRFVDGGYRDNTPSNLKYYQSQDKDLVIENITGNKKKIKSAVKAGRVLAFAFGSPKEDDPVQMALYSAKRKIYNPGIIERFVSNILYKTAVGVGGDFKYTQTVENTFQELRHNALNVVTLDTKNIGTLSFAAANRKGEYLHIKGYMETMRHMRNHELTKYDDKSFETKDFFLKIYEKIEEPTLGQFWLRKISSGYHDKSEQLLSFCKSEKLETQEAMDIWKNYIKLAATNRRTGNIDVNTNTIKKMIETLNDPHTSTQIKTDFVALLKGEKFLLNGNHDIANFKFTKDDFKDLLSKQGVKIGKTASIKR